MTFEAIHLLTDKMAILELNGTPITRTDVDTFLSTYTDWALAYDEQCVPFIYTDASVTQSIVIANPTGGAAMEFKSAPFVGGRPAHRPW